MWKKSYFFAFLFIWGCNTAVKEANQTNDLIKAEKGTIYNGYWVDKLFIELLKQRHSIVAIEEVPPILELAFLFAKNDSVLSNSGTKIEKFSIRFTDEDTIFFNLGKLCYDKTADIEFLYWIEPKTGKKRPFERMGNNYVTESKDGFTHTLTAFINTSTLVGDYFFMDDKGRKTDDFTAFKPDGSIIGWDKYAHYSVCLDKEILARNQNKKDVLLLSKDSEAPEYYAWEMFDYDKENEKEENKGKRPKQFGTSLKLYKMTEKKGLKNKPDFELSVSRLSW